MGCKTPKSTFYNPTTICEMKTTDEKIVLRSQVRFSYDSKSEKENLINKMYEKILFNGFRQQKCELNQLIIDANPRVNYKDFLDNFWKDNSREGRFHKILNKKKSLKTPTTYLVEFNINELKKYLNENNIK